MKSRLIHTSALLLLLVSMSASFGASAERKQAEAQILERNQFRCNNCFFGPSDYYFCFAADNKVILAHAKIPTLNWRDDHQNYFGKVHAGWRDPDPAGQSVSILYDDKFVWMPRSDGKQLRMTQDYSRDIFVANPQCRAAVKKSAQ